MHENRPIRIAVLGATGRQGRRRADAVNRVEGLALVVLADIPETRSALVDLAGRYACDCSTEWEETVCDERVDAVLICTPNSRHAEMAMAALARGKHVLVEKPMANSMSEVAELVDEAELGGLTLKAGFNYPFRAPIHKGFQHLFGGAIGALLGFRGVISHSQFLGSNGGSQWFCQPELAGHGAWLDLGIHLVDLANWAVSACGDEFSTVNAQMSHGRLICTEGGRAVLEEECIAVYRTGADRLVSVHASWVEARPFLGARIELIGERGRVEIDLGTRTTRLVQWQAGRVTETVEEFGYVDPDPSWCAELELFRDMILGTVQKANGDLKVHRLAFGAYESARSGGMSVSLAGETAPPPVPGSMTGSASDGSHRKTDSEWNRGRETTPNAVEAGTG